MAATSLIHAVQAEVQVEDAEHLDRRRDGRGMRPGCRRARCKSE